MKAHVEVGRGGVVELDELPPERCRKVALDDPEPTLLALAEELLPTGGDWSKDGTAVCLWGTRNDGAVRLTWPKKILRSDAAH